MSRWPRSRCRAFRSGGARERTAPGVAGGGAVVAGGAAVHQHLRAQPCGGAGWRALGVDGGVALPVHAAAAVAADALAGRHCPGVALDPRGPGRMAVLEWRGLRAVLRPAQLCRRQRAVVAGRRQFPDDRAGGNAVRAAVVSRCACPHPARRVRGGDVDPRGRAADAAWACARRAGCAGLGGIGLRVVVRVCLSIGQSRPVAAPGAQRRGAQCHPARVRDDPGQPAGVVGTGGVGMDASRPARSDAAGGGVRGGAGGGCGRHHPVFPGQRHGAHECHRDGRGRGDAGLRGRVCGRAGRAVPR